MQQDELNSNKSLGQLIEKIVEKGSLSQEDQNEINSVALRGNLRSEDVAAMGSLTELITSGRINVI